MSIMLSTLTARFDSTVAPLGAPASEDAIIDGDAAMVAEYDARREAGLPSAHDIANAAVASAEAGLGILTGDRENVEAGLVRDAHLAYKRARASAGLAARFLASGREDAAHVAAKFAEAQALEIRALEPSKFDGLPLVPAFPKRTDSGRSRKHYNG